MTVGVHVLAPSTAVDATMERTMSATLKRFVNDERGLETVEYAVMTALIVAGLVLAIAALGNAVKNKFSGVTNDVNGGS